MTTPRLPLLQGIEIGRKEGLRLCLIGEFNEAHECLEGALGYVQDGAYTSRYHEEATAITLQALHGNSLRRAIGLAAMSRVGSLVMDEVVAKQILEEAWTDQTRIIDSLTPYINGAQACFVENTRRSTSAPRHAMRVEVGRTNMARGLAVLGIQIYNGLLGTTQARLAQAPFGAAADELENWGTRSDKATLARASALAEGLNNESFHRGHQGAAS